MHLETITELLGIPNYKVAEMIKNTPDRIQLMLEQIEVTDPICSGCGRHHNSSVHSTGRVVVEDLRISGKRIFLHVPNKKSICIENGKIRVEEIAWIRGRFTTRFVEQVCRLTSIITNKEAGWYLGLDDERV